MADHVCRALRDGCLDGEHAVALSIKDTLRSPFGDRAFDYFLCSLASNVCSGKSQARGIVLVALDRSPSFYLSLLKRKGLAYDRCLSILDCYSDPIGWKKNLGRPSNVSEENSRRENVSVFTNVRDAGKFSQSIFEIGGVIGEGKSRFSVAIDSVSTLLRHLLLPSVANLINLMRSNDKVSSVLWLIHSDLHELRQATAIEYMSSMVASLEPKLCLPEGGTAMKDISLLEQNLVGGNLFVRIKRRNGRVKIIQEHFNVEKTDIKFDVISLEHASTIQNLLPKVQFNLNLSEKERADRAKVVLPFEHQGNGDPIQIYDGRQSSLEDKKSIHIQKHPFSGEIDTQHDGKGEIHYIRDSDDETPDSDEDPDDDLDI